MRGRAQAVVVAVVLLGVFGLGGCRGGERAALPARPAEVSAPSASDATTDPLAGIESDVVAVERDVDADARPTGRR